jgi:hypothetical protein
VTLSIYTPFPPTGPSKAVFEAFDDGGKLAEVVADTCTHPRTDRKRNQFGSFDQDSYPHYMIARSRNLVDVLEFRRGPVFCLVDDPDLIREANDAVASGRCFQ